MILSDLIEIINMKYNDFNFKINVIGLFEENVDESEWKLKADKLDVVWFRVNFYLLSILIKVNPFKEVIKK